MNDFIEKWCWQRAAGKSLTVEDNKVQGIEEVGASLRLSIMSR